MKALRFCNLRAFLISEIIQKSEFIRRFILKLNKKAPKSFDLNAFIILTLQCPEQDSNLHTVTGTSPSSWRVYQFHHLGIYFCVCKTIKNLNICSAFRINNLKDILTLSHST